MPYRYSRCLASSRINSLLLIVSILIFTTTHSSNIYVLVSCVTGRNFQRVWLLQKPERSVFQSRGSCQRKGIYLSTGWIFLPGSFNGLQLSNGLYLSVNHQDIFATGSNLSKCNGSFNKPYLSTGRISQRTDLSSNGHDLPTDIIFQQAASFKNERAESINGLYLSTG